MTTQETINNLHDDLSALENAAARLGSQAFLPLDRTYESLDRAEDLFAFFLTTKNADVSPEVMESRLARYVGETLRIRAGGRWESGQARNENFGKPCIGSLPDLPGTTQFFPHLPVVQFRRNRVPGWLRDATVPYDLACSRQEFALWESTIATQIAFLGDEVKQRTGQAGVLDGAIDSVELLEQTVLVALDQGIDRDGRRRLRAAAAAYLGELVRSAAPGPWSLCEDPVDLDFGWPRIHGWAPASVVTNLLVRRTPGILRRALQTRLKRLGAGQ